MAASLLVLLGKHAERLALALVVVLLSGCATIRSDYQATASTAFERPAETTLGRAYVAPQAETPGLSGFRLLNNGVSALMTRAAMADLAERAIDVQYYIFDPDDVGSFFLDRILAAADRGVRVRMILDDYLIGFDEATLARINAHPNVELRIFNPYRDRARWSRHFQMLFNLDSLGRRMHNKIYVVDGQAAVMGGRNISNHYFEGEGEANFRDIDLLVSGPAALEAGRIFDAFWNSPIVVPVAAFGHSDPAAGDAALAAIRDRGRNGEGPPKEYLQRKPEYVRRILGAEGMLWAKGQAIGEPPVRQAVDAAKPSSEVARAMAIARQNSTREVIYEAAYFVPGDRGVEVLTALAARGVGVRVLTNSLAATDVVAVHAGYAPYREALVSGGVDLYEYRPDADRPTPAGGHRVRLGRSESALHAKIAIYDRKLVWVGSANFDPRSRRLNTEAGLLIESPPLAERLLAGIARDFSPQHSWRLTLEASGDSPRRLVWSGERDGKPVRLEHEPDAGFWRSLSVVFYSLIPGLEDLL